MAASCFNMSSLSFENSNIVQENSFVIIKKGDIMKAYQVKKNKPVYICKQKINLGGVIGHEFGSVFEVKNNNVVKLVNDGNKLLTEVTEINVSKDNRTLVDDGKSQKLTKDEIELLKEKGISGEEMVGHLIANSKTFNEKTEFSQEKYLKKKQKKYSNQLLVLKPTTRLIIEMYSSQGPLKILNLRCDSLAQILANCNIHSGGNYIIFDSCLGLVVGAALERVGKSGCIIQIHDMDVPQQQAVTLYNFSEETKNCLLSVKMQEIETVLKETVKEEMVISSDEEEKKTDGSAEQLKLDEKVSIVSNRRVIRIAQLKRAKDLLISKNIHGIVIACKYSPIEPTLFLMKYLQLSCPFVVYCMYKECLIDLYTILKESGEAISLWLTETWLREYQVLPNRTHPSINMSNSGGFILSGIKVDPR